MLEDGEVVIFSQEGGTAKPLRSFHAEATCHQSCIFRVCPVSTKLICLTIAVHGGLPRRTWLVSPSTRWPKASLCRPQSVHGFNVDIHRWFRSALPCCMRKEPRPCIFSMAKSLRGLPAAVCAWASVVDKQGCLCFSFFKKTK